MINRAQVVPGKFWTIPSNISTNGLNLQSVCKIMSKRFPFMNISGLMQLKGLSVLHTHENKCSVIKTIGHNFYVRYNQSNKWVAGLIEVEYHPTRRKVIIKTMYPNLPQKQMFGRTLVSLLLIRGNTMAKNDALIEFATDQGRSMTKNMGIFKPRLVNIWGDESDDIKLTVPLLNEKELAAVEWIWKKIIC